MTDQDHIDYLLTRYIGGQSTAAETTELFDWIRDKPDAELIRARMQEFWNDYQGDRVAADFDRIFASIQKAMPARRRAPLSISRPWLRAAAAILILIMAGASAWLLLRSRSRKEPVAQAITKQDIPAPAQTHAILTLSNGQKIILDTANNGALAQQGRIDLVKTAGGEITYNGKATGTTALTYNTLSNPRGSKVVTIALNDGTRVWLNAASAVTYPVAFTGTDRTVEVTGEAYFEIAKDPAKPFIVRTTGQEIRVLGTHFNVNSYSDEPTTKTTLLEGSIKITSGNRSLILKPGEQADQLRSGGLSAISGVDLVETMAWKNGLFAFHNADLPAVMRQLARWYNIEVTYEGHIPQEKFQFNGKMGKDLTLSEVLDLLTNAQVHFAIEAGNKLVIRP
jgi:transmembrane sensor